MARPRAQFWTFLSRSQVGMKQRIFSPPLLEDIGGAISPVQRRVETGQRRSTESHCGLAPNPFIGFWEHVRGWLERSFVGSVLGFFLGRSVGYV